MVYDMGGRIEELLLRDPNDNSMRSVRWTASHTTHTHKYTLPPHAGTALDHTLTRSPHFPTPSHTRRSLGSGDAQPQCDCYEGECPLAGRGVDALRQPHW